MTRKDYIGIAAAILATQTRIKNEFRDQRSAYEAARDEDQLLWQLRGVRRAAAHICEFLADDNPRFDPAQFLTACGYGGTPDYNRTREAAGLVNDCGDETVKVRGQDRVLSEFVECSACASMGCDECDGAGL